MLRQMVISALVLLAWSFAASAPATAQSVEVAPLMDRLERLERDLQTLSRNFYRGGGSGTQGATGAPAAALAEPLDGPGAAQMSIRLSQLETQMRDMTGSLETLGHDIYVMNGRLDKLVGDIDFRLSNLERGVSTPQSNIPQSGATPGNQPAVSSVPPSPAISTGAPPTTFGSISEDDLKAMDEKAANLSPVSSEPPLPSQPNETTAPAEQAPQVASAASSAKEQYDQARKLLFNGSYDRAEQALTDFLAKYENDPLAGNARYWLGETYYVRHDYIKAAETFIVGYQKDPKGNKAPDSLLKLGMSLSRLDQKKDACATFAKLQSEHPDASANVKRVAERERANSGCK